MKKAIISATTAAAFIVSCATANSANDEMSAKAAETLSKYELTGETKNCVSSNFIRTIDAIDDRHFLVILNNGKTYLNNVSGRCSGADRGGNRLQYTLSLSQLCRNEIIQVIDNSSGFQVGSCGLGSFEELEKLPEAPEAD